ncbi:hypothetical protein DAEQUDRAFT_420005 [Daedalea quercina L-15889]|uniref:Uncharacterized protein n=1 Tax=Daedalea quercina L-15889 TaxID=1314783 RepID=A0A165TKT7_9APHY|nr:hypothetical protein DAEQUDRAFT_420005 [Daedalea quercina L-15889]
MTRGGHSASNASLALTRGAVNSIVSHSSCSSSRSSSGILWQADGWGVGLNDARQLPRRQQPQPGQGVAGANEFTQIPVPNDLGREENAYATIQAGDRQYAPTGYSLPSRSPHLEQEGGRGQVQRALTDYGTPVLSLSPFTASPQLPGASSSSSGSPVGSTGSQLSRQSGSGGPRITQDAFHGAGAAEYAHRAQGVQMGAMIHAQGAQNASPQSINSESAYSAYIRRVGLRQTGFEDVPHGITGNALQRPQVHRSASTSLVVGLSAQNVLDVPHQVEGGHPQAPPLPQTPQLDFRTRQLSLDGSPVHFGSHLQQSQQPYGVPLPIQAPPPPVPWARGAFSSHDNL